MFPQHLVNNGKGMFYQIVVKVREYDIWSLKLIFF